MVILLNSSLKGKRGNGYYLLGRLQECKLGECVERNIVSVLKDIKGFLEELAKADALVIAAPLYVDGLPAQVLRLMEAMYERRDDMLGGLPVYVVSNLGFFESSQIRPLLDMVRNWCVRMNFVYGGGVAVGAGGMMSAFRSVPLGKGPNRSLGRALTQLAQAIREKKQIENAFVQPDWIPRFGYMMAAHSLFRSTGRKNGAKVE